MHNTPAIAKPIILVGMMGCGKTAVGLALADRLEIPFYDADAWIVQNTGRSIPKIFADDGEAAFRSLEVQAIKELLDMAPCVIASGGGALTSPENLAAIKQNALSIWLHADIDTIYARVSGDKNRPLLQVENPKAALKELSDARENLYSQADLKVENMGKTSCAVNKILSAIAELEG